MRRLPSVIVLLSDGKNTSGTRDPLEIAARGRARAASRSTRSRSARPAGEVELRDSFGFLQRVQVPPDTETLKEIARALRRQVLHRRPRPTRSRRSTPTWARGSRPRARSDEVTAAFAGGAIALLIAAGSLSLRWFGRLI